MAVFLSLRLRVLALCALVFGALMCVPQVALASDAAAAETLFRSAREAVERGDWVTACDRFEESKRLEPAPGTVLNLARCREELGQVASAWKSYEEAAERLPVGDDRAAFARKRAQEIEPRVPRLVLVAPDTDEDFLVTVGGVEYSSATFGVPLPFDPGTLAIVVSAEGRQDQVFETKLTEGEVLEHQLVLGPREAVRESNGGTDDQGRSKGSVSSGAIVAFSVGGLGVAASVLGGILAAREVSTVNDHCDPDGRCDRQGDDAARRGRTGVYVLGGGIAAALVGVGLGTYFVLSPSRPSEVSFSPLRGGGMLQLKHSL